MTDSWVPAARKLYQSKAVRWAVGIAAAVSSTYVVPWLQGLARRADVAAVQEQVATPAERATLPTQDGAIVTLTARVRACESRGFELEQRLRERRQIESELLEAIVRVNAATAEPKAARRAESGRAAVERLRDLIRRDTPPLEALRVVLETKPP